MNRIATAAFITLFIAGCSVSPQSRIDIAAPETSAPEVFEPVPGRDASVIASLRAAPAPPRAEVIDGKNLSADERQLGAQAYVRIGTSRHPVEMPDIIATVVEQASKVGADKVLTYPHFQAADPAGTGSPIEVFLAVYYVRFRLPFGATFRDLSAAERKTLISGVQIGNVIGGSPASDANLRVGDYITRIDGKIIDNKAAFQAQLKARAGKVVQLTIQRNGEEFTRSVRLGTVAPIN